MEMDEVRKGKRGDEIWGGGGYLCYLSSFFPGCYRCENETSMPGFAEYVKVSAGVYHRRGPGVTPPATRLCSAACVCNVQRPNALRQQQDPCREVQITAQPPGRGGRRASKGLNRSSGTGSTALERFDIASDLADSKATRMLPGPCFNPQPTPARDGKALGTHGFMQLVSVDDWGRALAACKSGFWRQ